MNQETERQLAQFEQMRTQYQTLATQLFQYRQMIKETERAMEEMDKLDEGAKVYREIGALMVEVDDREKLKEELKDRVETLEIRTRTLESQEEAMKEHLTTLKVDLQSALSSEK